MPTGESSATHQREHPTWVSRALSIVERYLLFALPVITVSVVVVAVFVVGVPGSYRAVRVWGGPTDTTAGFSGRLQAVERYYEVERPLENLPLVAHAMRDGEAVARVEGRTDQAGYWDFSFSPDVSTRGQVELKVLHASTVLAAGSARLSTQEWRARAGRRGGWVTGRKTNPFKIRVRGQRGVFAVPFRDRVIVEVSDASGPIVGAEVKLRFEGVSLPTSVVRLLSDERGIVEQALAPLEHVVSLSVEAAYEGRRQTWHSTLPVIPGALHAELLNGKLRIASAIPRDFAFFTLVSEHARLVGGHIPLKPDGRGGAVGQVSVDVGKEPLFCVVSSEPDMQTVAAVGWPLSTESTSTFDAAEFLLIDGLPAAYRQSLLRPRRARWIAAGFTALALLLTILLLSRRVRHADLALDAHLERSGADPKRLKVKELTSSLLIAAVALGLGFLVVALVTLAQID